MMYSFPTPGSGTSQLPLNLRPSSRPGSRPGYANGERNQDRDRPQPEMRQVELQTPVTSNTAVLEPGSFERAPLHELMASSLVLLEDVEKLTSVEQDHLIHATSFSALMPRLVGLGLVTQYQADRIDAGKTYGLVLGNYRILERLGAGGMGVVFRAEHLVLRRSVAIKVLSIPDDTDPLLLQRFNTEMRIVAQLQHPNIVGATDAGVFHSTDPDQPTMRYYVMEHVVGRDLEAIVEADGAMGIHETCDMAYQVASALVEAQRHNLVHRDIKPSNILITEDGQAKLLDFGLARHLPSRCTEPGTILGTLNFMAPEQATDASSVDIRADLYGLGGTMYWCLTGKFPFPFKGNMSQDILARMTQPPPSARTHRFDLPADLDDLLNRMLAPNPANRFSSPQNVQRALLPFLRPELRDHLLMTPGRESRAESRETKSTPIIALPAVPSASGVLKRQHQVLIIDDDTQVREFCKFMLKSDEIACAEAANGPEGIKMLAERHYDLVLLDIDMPKMKGDEVCRLLRQNPPFPNLKIVMLSGRASNDEMAQIMLTGADDYLGKPMSITQLQARVKNALQLKDAQDRSDTLAKRLYAANQQMETNLQSKETYLTQARNAMVLALAELAGYRDAESGTHLTRMQRYVRVLAEAAAELPEFAAQIDPRFVETIEACVPLHDIGKAALPDYILSKPGKLTTDERFLMQTHTTSGAETLEKVSRQQGFAQDFMKMAVEVARHHHERYDGSGYPDALVGPAIPLAARIVAIADVYDALRVRRVYKPALSHTMVVRMMTLDMSSHFDPLLLELFRAEATQFEKIFREMAE